MKKIMFNVRYGLTRAVIEGRKTMTRRLCKDNATGEVILAREVDSCRYYPEENLVEFVMKNGDIKTSTPQYRVGEEVAVGQNYEDALERFVLDSLRLMDPVAGLNFSKYIDLSGVVELAPAKVVFIEPKEKC